MIAKSKIIKYVLHMIVLNMFSYVWLTFACLSHCAPAQKCHKPKKLSSFKLSCS